MTIDPSVRDVGIAYWLKQETLKPHATAVLRGPRGIHWVESLWSIVKEYRVLLGSLTPLKSVYIEWPSVWTGSAKSMSGAAAGDLGKLWTSVGALMAASRIHNPEIKLYPVPVNDWKGQLPKKAVCSRIMRTIGETYPDHVSDTVGIGLALQGRL